MVADAAVSREPQSLQETLAASQRESVSAGTPPQTNQSGDATDEQQPDGTLGKFIEAITEFFEEAEKNVSARDRRRCRRDIDRPSAWTTPGATT